MNKVLSLGILGSLLVFVFTRLWQLNSLPPFMDELIYVRWLNHINQTHDWLLPLKEFGWEPLNIWIAVIINLLIKDSLLSLRLTAVFFGFLTLICLYFALKKFFKPLTVHLILFTYLISPIILLHDRLGLRGDSAVSFCYSLTLLGLTQRLVKQKSTASYLIALAVILGLLIKTTAVIIPITVLISFMAFKPKIFKHDLLAPLLTPLPLLFYYFTHTLNLVLNKSSVFVSTGNWPVTVKNNLIQHLTWLYQYLNWPIILLFFIGLVFLFKNSKDFFKLLLIGLLTSSLFITLTAKILFPRYFLLTYLSFLIAAGYGLSIIVSHLPRLLKPLAVIFLIPSLILSTVIVINIKSARLPEIERWQYVTGWPSGYGLSDLVDYLKANPPAYLITENSDLVRTGLVYLWPNSSIKIIPMDDYLNYDSGQISSGSAYLALNVLQTLPAKFKAELIKEFPRPENKTTLKLYQLK